MLNNYLYSKSYHFTLSKLCFYNLKAIILPCKSYAFILSFGAFHFLSINQTVFERKMKYKKYDIFLNRINIMLNRIDVIKTE